MENICELFDIIQDKNRIITEHIDEKYLSDSLGRLKGTASAVVFPISTEEVSEIMKWAYEEKFLLLQGGRNQFGWFHCPRSWRNCS